jgi:hypothetical protein
VLDRASMDSIGAAGDEPFLGVVPLGRCRLGPGRLSLAVRAAVGHTTIGGVAVALLVIQRLHYCAPPNLPDDLLAIGRPPSYST